MRFFTGKKDEITPQMIYDAIQNVQAEVEALREQLGKKGVPTEAPSRRKVGRQ